MCSPNFVKEREKRGGKKKKKLMDMFFGSISLIDNIHINVSLIYKRELYVMFTLKWEKCVIFQKVSNNFTKFLALLNLACS